MRPKPGSTKERILEGTLRVIAQHGIESFKVKDVAEAASVSTQLLYHHYSNKEALIRAALNFAALRAPSVEHLLDQNEPNGLAALRSSLRSEFEDSVESRELNVLWNEVAAIPFEDDGAREELAFVTKSWANQLTSTVLRGRADQSIQSTLEPAMLADALTATVEGLSQRWLAEILSGDQAILTIETMLHTLCRNTLASNESEDTAE